MDRKKVLVADTSQELCGALSKALAESCDLEMCHDGMEALLKLDVFAPEVMVVDLALPSLDGISLLKELHARQVRPRVLLTTCLKSDYVMDAVSTYEVDMMVMKPCDITSLSERIFDLAYSTVQTLPRVHLEHGSVSYCLRILGIPTNRKGYQYLEYCVNRCSEGPRVSMTKELYPQVAQMHNTTAAAVERAMRDAILDAWNRRDENTWRMFFGTARTGVLHRPTNSEFISTLAQRLRLESLERAEGYVF